MDPLAAFECQYTCNGDDNCRAYFVLYGWFPKNFVLVSCERKSVMLISMGWAVDVDTDQEYAGCTLYDDM